MVEVIMVLPVVIMDIILIPLVVDVVVIMMHLAVVTVPPHMIFIKQVQKVPPPLC